MYKMKKLLISMMMILVTPCLVYSTTEESHIFTVSDAERIIREYMIRNTPWGEDQIKLKNISISNKIVLPATGDYEIKPSPKATMIGRTSFALNITENDRTTQTYWINADIGIWVDVILTSRSMKDHQVISEDDIYMGKKDIAELPPGYLDDIKEVVGKRFKRFIGTNRPVTEDILEELPLFKRGEKVFIVAESESLKVIAAGVANSEGYRGHTVKVINMQSKKEVIGEVIDNETVKVKW